ncbi:hypothetical protein J1614_002567 [Plenodomus biglobosus]|nr:hypothetical protein J1614_002567 [Plenodomus biglobosus]
MDNPVLATHQASDNIHSIISSFSIYRWVPPIGGLMLTVRGDAPAPRELVQLYYLAFHIGKRLEHIAKNKVYSHLYHVGFAINAVMFYASNIIFPVQNMD